MVGQWVIPEGAWPLPCYSITHEGIVTASWPRASIYRGILLEGSPWSKLISHGPCRGFWP